MSNSQTHTKLIIYAQQSILSFDYQMKNSFSERLDPDQIRQGLLSIRNTQLELLNQLKVETEMLKNYSPSTNSQLSSIQKKWERFPSFCLESPQQEVHTISSGRDRLSNEKSLRQQINYLQNQNKLLSSNINKMRKSCQNDKQINKELQQSLTFACKLFYHILNRILQGENLKSVAQTLFVQIRKCSISKLKEGFENILILLQQKEKIKDESKMKNIDGEKGIACQLIDLKSQISLLLNQSNRFDNNNSQKEITKLKEQIGEKSKAIEQQTTIIEQKQASINKLQHQYQQMKQLWQKQINQRKIVMAQWEKLVKQSKLSQEKQKKIIFYAKDMENKAAKFQKAIKEKDTNESIQKENYQKLSENMALLRQTNQALRHQVKSLEETKEKKYQLLFQQKRQLQKNLKELNNQHQKLLQNKQIELISLRNHLFEIKRNQQSLKELQRKQKDNGQMQQEIYWKKVNIIRTNSTINHLWQVKEVQYENINQLITKMKR